MSEQKSNDCPWKVLAPALTKAQASITSIGKDSRNDYGGYQYTSAEHMVDTCRGVLLDAGLTIQRLGAEIRIEGGDDGQLILENTFMLLHKSGALAIYRMDYPICPGKGRPSDKAGSASLTTSLNYFVRDLLLVPRFDDEVDRRDDTPSGTRGRGGVRPTPKPGANKQTFVKAVAKWIGKDITEQSTTEACLAVLRLHKLPTDGTCSGRQFGEMAVWVTEQDREGEDAANILREPQA